MASKRDKEFKSKIKKGTKRKLEKSSKVNDEPDKKIQKEEPVVLDEVQQILNSILLAKGKNSIALGKQVLSLSPDLKKEDLKQFITLLKSMPTAKYNLPKELVEFTTNQKPKLRKQSQTQLLALLTENREENPEVIEFVILYFTILNQHYGSSGSILLRYLNFMANICHMLSKEQVASVFQVLFVVMDKGGLTGITCGLSVLRIMYKGQNNMKSTDLTHYVNHVYKYQPSMKNIALVKEWFLTHHLGLDTLYRLDEEASKRQLVKYFKVASRYWQIKDIKTQAQIFSSLNNLSNKVAFQGQTNEVEFIFKNLEKIILDNSSPICFSAIQLVGNLFKNLDQPFFDITKGCISKVCEATEKKMEYNEEQRGVINQTLKVVAKKYGPSKLLQLWPGLYGNLGENIIDKKCIGIFEENIEGSEMSIFLKKLVPLLKTLEGGDTEKSDNTMSLKVWSLLPYFCKEPTDIIKNAKPMVHFLLESLKTHPDMKQIILLSFKNLFSSKMDEKNTHILKELSKTVLDTLLNLEKPQEDNFVVFEAISVCLKIVDEKIQADHLKTYLKALQTKLSSKNLSDIELGKTMPYLLAGLNQTNSDLFKECMETVKSMVENENMVIKKAGFEIIERIASSSDYLNTGNLVELNDLFFGKKLQPSLRATVFKSLLSIIRQMKTGDEELVKKILHKAILGTKENKKESRIAAFNLITEIGLSHIRWKVKETSGDCLKDFIGLILPGLTEDSFQTSATMLSLAMIITELKHRLTQDIVLLLIHNVSLLLASKCEEILHSCLSVIKSLVSSENKELILQYLDTLLTNLLLIFESKNRELRAIAKSLLERLVKIFSRKTIQELVSSEQELLLNQLLDKKVKSDEKKEE